MTNKEETFNEFWPNLPRKLKALLKNLEKYPRERNVCFIQGYISALNENGVITNGEHGYVSALINTLKDSSELQQLIKDAT